VDGERGDVGRPDDAADRERRPQLGAALLEPGAEQRGRQRGVDEADGVARDLDRLHRVLADRLAQLGRAHLEQGAVVRAARRDQHMVDRRRQVAEEPLQGRRVADVERGGPPRAEFPRRPVKPAGITAGEDHLGALGPGAPGRLEPDARAAADDDDGLAGELVGHVGSSVPACSRTR